MNDHFHHDSHLSRVVRQASLDALPRATRFMMLVAGLFLFFGIHNYLQVRPWAHDVDDVMYQEPCQ
jgi:hypothetical protein